ncbi:MAG: L-lactate dehydrogenase [Vicinamibacterales bacterium]
MARAVSVGIIGTGAVGASVAVSTLHGGVAQSLLLHDLRTAVAEGEAMDLADGGPFYPTAAVRSVDLEALLETDALVVAAGRNGRPGESRLDLLRDNVIVVRELGDRLRRYGGVVVVVSNPVDVLTFELTRASGLPPERVLGTGTMLDTARLRHVVGAALTIDPRSVHAQVVGEHGDSEVALWSSATAGGVPLRQWPSWTDALETQLTGRVRTAAYEIIKRKGVTNHAIGLVTASLLKAVLRGEERVLTVSRVQHGAAGLHDVALSLPTVVGAGGAARVMTPVMTADEQQRLDRSAEILRAALAAVA